MLDESGIPIPVTSNNWKPIEAFNFEADYARDNFIVWFADGSWDLAYVDADNRFDGAWRHALVPVDPDADFTSYSEFDDAKSKAMNEMEPIAFKLVEGPNPDHLKKIVETYYKKAA